MEVAFKFIDEALANESLDEDCLSALIMCECRMLYKNHEMVCWVEESFKLFFKETHQKLSERTASSKVKEAITDVLSMVNLEDKK